MKNEPLILLHGWGMSPQVFEPILKLLEPQTLFSPGLPGYPGSPWPANRDFDQQLEAMARDLPSGELFGWSLGGLYAIELARRWPQKFSRVILIACNPCFVKQSGWNCAVDAEIFDSFCAELTQDWQRTLRRFLALQMQGASQARGMIRQLSQQIIAAGTPDIEVLRFGLELLKHRDARDSLRQLQQPLSLILGERDSLVPAALQQQIADVVPGIKVESLAGAAHAPFLSHPAEVVALL